MTTKHQVIDAHRENPTWTASQIANFLGCGRPYVAATARRNSLVLPRTNKNHNDPVQLRSAARLHLRHAEKLLARAKAIEEGQQA